MIIIKQNGTNKENKECLLTKLIVIEQNDILQVTFNCYFSFYWKLQEFYPIRAICTPNNK